MAVAMLHHIRCDEMDEESSIRGNPVEMFEQQAA